MEYMFRDLRADEVNVRVAQVGTEKDGEIPWFTCLLYKDARCDMDILDETVGPMNWQRHHSRENANCIIAIWDESKKQWVEKEDTGTESSAEAQKGIASDSFKRAGTNWGIGRELYTAPCYDVDKIRLALFSGACKAAFYCNTECASGDSIRCVAEFRLRGQSAHDGDYIQHVNPPNSSFQTPG